ncbi:MAG: toll/interleukin-1 receptor domain-containing protein [Ktedonobacteraceae bacterium]
MVQYFCEIDDPRIQEELYKATSARMPILLASLGLSVAAHVNSRIFPPTWEDLLQQIVEWCIENPASSVKENYNNLLEEGRVKKDRFQDAVRIIDEFLEGERKITCLSKILLCDQIEERNVPSFLVNQPLNKYLRPDSNYRNFIDRTYQEAAESSLEIFYETKMQNVIEAYEGKKPFIFELYRDKGKPIPTVLDFSRLVFDSLSDASGNYWGSFQKIISEPSTILLQFEAPPAGSQGDNDKKSTTKRWMIAKKGQIFQRQAEILWSKGIITVEYRTDDALKAFLEKLALPPIEIYIASVRKDQNLRTELEKHLRRLQKNLSSRCNITIWDGGEIKAGAEWQTEFKEHLAKAHVILLLVSIDLLDSEFDEHSAQNEIKAAMKRHEDGHACVIPILLRDCIWQDEEFAKLQVLPANQKPLTSSRNRDGTLTDITKEIKKSIMDLVSKSYLAP